MATSSEEKLYHIVNISDRIAQADDKIIVLLGPTGVGKSNFIERLSAHDLGISSSGSHRGTKVLQVYRLMHHPIWNSCIVLVDTPGLNNAEISEYSVLKLVKEWLVTSKALHLHALFYFDRITHHLRRGDEACYDLFMRLCDKDGAERVCLVTTAWDEVGMRDGVSIGTGKRSLSAAEEKRRQLRAHWKDYIEKGLQFCEFQNTAASALDILMGSLKYDDYSHQFLIEDPLLRLEKPPLAHMVFGMLTAKRDMTVQALSLLEEDIKLMRGQGRETSRYVNKLEALGVVVKRLEEETLAFEGLWRPTRTSVESHQGAAGRSDVALRVPIKPVSLDFLEETSIDVAPITAKDIRVDDIIIAVTGPTGTGKTKFIQSIADTANVGLNLGHSVSAGTTEVTCVKIAIPGTHSSLILVDTPGFDDPDKTDAQILEIIANWLESTYRRRILLTGLVYLHRITDIRHDVGIQNTMNVFQRLVGPSAFERVALVTTMWNDLRDKQIGVEREEQLMNNHWRPMIIRKAMTGRFDSNNRDTAVKVIRNIVERNTKTVLLQLQGELVDKKKSLPSTSAGKVAFTLEEAMKWRLRQLTGTLNR